MNLKPIFGRTKILSENIFAWKRIVSNLQMTTNLDTQKIRSKILCRKKSILPKIAIWSRFTPWKTLIELIFAEFCAQNEKKKFWRKKYINSKFDQKIYVRIHGMSQERSMVKNKNNLPKKKFRQRKKDRLKLRVTSELHTAKITYFFCTNNYFFFVWDRPL